MMPLIRLSMVIFDPIVYKPLHKSGTPMNELIQWTSDQVSDANLKILSKDAFG